jgi:hypothetical protein
MSRARSWKVFALFVSVPLLMTLAFEPAHAAYSRTKRYEISAPGVARQEKDPVCAYAQCATTDKTIDVGGVVFSPIRGGTTLANVKVTAKDDHQDIVGVVRLGACQDLNNDNTCGGAGEPNIDGCVRYGQYLTLARVRRTKPITVFVYTQWGCPKYLIPDVVDRNGGGTTGIVKIVWS